MDIAQPDLMRNGVGETVAIATIAAAHHVPVALHTGVVTVVGMAASWQVASALPNFIVQEFQPVMLETFGHLVEERLTAADGVVHVPTGPGIGVTVDEGRVRTMASSVVGIGLCARPDLLARPGRSCLSETTSWRRVPGGTRSGSASPGWTSSAGRWPARTGSTVAGATSNAAEWGVCRRRRSRSRTAPWRWPSTERSVVIGQDGTTKQRVVVCSDFPDVRTNDMTARPRWAPPGRAVHRGPCLAGWWRRCSRPDDGPVTSVLDGYVTANGLAVTLDGEALYAVDTGRCTITRHGLLRHGNASGSTESGRILVQHKGPGVLDGIVLGPDGDIWVAVWGAGELRRYSSAGRLLGVVAVPVARPSAVAVVPLDAAPHLVVTTARSHPPGTEEDGTALRPDLEGRLYTTPLMD